ncbi:MAG: hypothetical protein V1841_01105 [Patescibacteria group bacterium]
MIKKTEGKEFFIGIDLGWREKKTTGICILERQENSLFPQKVWQEQCQDILGRNVIRKVTPFLKNAKTIVVDAPLTEGRGKGDMRLFEKFFSTKSFKEKNVSPLPPALVPQFAEFAREIREKLEERGFVLDRNLIEVSTKMTREICGDNIFINVLGKALEEICCTQKRKFKKEKSGVTIRQKDSLCAVCKTQNQRWALLCAAIAYLHFVLKTRYIGYKDGFLFLPEMAFWKGEWRRIFYDAWMSRSRFKYHYLTTNIFNKR